MLTNSQRQGRRYTSRLRIYLVEDSEIMLNLLRELLVANPMLEVVGQSTSATSAVREIAALRPDVAIIDIALEDGSGFDVLRAPALHGDGKWLIPIVLSNFASQRYRDEARRLGARHFFDKNYEFVQMLSTISEIAKRLCAHNGSEL